ncbi:MAG: hypothetical protein KGL39_15640 [Patescibacteria group bacterium]|nr:hypothetical protein [Patescibacteria group bacterium]
MTWKKWRVGFWLTILLGCLSAGAGVAVGMTWQAFVAVLCTSLLTHIAAYMIKSPIEQVDDNPTQPKTPTP